MAQLGHPYAKQVQASQKRRLAALGAKAGKAWGSSASQHERKYPKEHAGTERPMTIAGKTAGKRADRYARGGKVKGGKGHTTNIVIASPRGQQQPDQARPLPVPVPVGAGAAPGMAPRPPMPPPALPPGGPGGLPMGGPPPVAGIRPPGMARGGHVTAGAGEHEDYGEFHNWGTGYKRGGHIKKRARGGSMFDDEAEPKKGETYKGYPHSPETDVEDAVSPTKRGGAVHRKHHRAHGGKVHSDEAEDKRLFGKMIKEHDKEEESHKRRGGHVKKGKHREGHRDLGGDVGPPPGKGMKRGGHVKHHRDLGGDVGPDDDERSEKQVKREGLKRGGHVKKRALGGSFEAGSGTGYSRLRRNAEAAKLPAKTEL